MTNSSKLRLSLFAAIALTVGCIPLPPPGGGSGGYPSQPQQSGWEQGAAPTSSEPDHYGEAGSGNSGNSGSSGSSDWWLCTATGSIGTAYGDGPWEYSTKTAHGNGPIRDDAYMQALEDCHAMMSMAASLASANDQKQTGGTCEVTDCIGPR